VRKDGQRASDAEVQLVWDAPSGAAKASPGTARQRRVLRRRTLLIGSGALALVAGAAYGVEALGAQPHHVKAGAATMALPSPLISAQATVSSLPTSPRPSLSRKSTPTSHATAATTHGDAAAAGPSSAAYQQPSVTNRQPSTSTAASPVPVGDWPLAGPASGSGAVADVVGSQPGTASDVQWGVAAGVGYGVFNGSSSLITTFGPVVDTGPGSSYTVSAWLYPVQHVTSSFMTAVSEDGGPEGDSGFYLSFSGPIDRWVFLVPGASAPASSSGAPVLDSWAHVVGVYDDADHQVRIYVDGALEGTAFYGSTYAGSDGSLVIGRAMYAGGDVDWFQGDIRDVQVFDQALTTSAIDGLG
jgi:hypothetical protein